MKTTFHIMTGIITMLASLTISCMPAAEEESFRTYTPLPQADSIMFKKEQMKAITDTAYHFWFSDDAELREADPHAYWLMNRMMQTVQYVRTAEDAVAWTLALNEDVKEYGRRIDRRIHDRRAEDAAAQAMENLIALYGAGNQPELNIESYVLSILEYYRLINSYIRLMDLQHDNELKRLLYREYREWFDINNAANGLMVFYTYAAGYSALPMDINYTFAEWSEKRSKELEIECDIFWSYSWQPYSSDSHRVSERRQEKLISYFKEANQDAIIDEVLSGWEEKDYEYAQKRFGESFDFDRIYEMATYYETALQNWKAVREQIKSHLPKQKQKSYSEITREINTRLYDDLLRLKKISY